MTRTTAASTARRVLCDTCGALAICLATLGTVLALCSLDLLGNGVVVWLVATAVFVLGSLYLWYGSSKSRGMSSEEWLMGVIFTPLLGAVSFAIDVFTGSTNGNYDSFVHAAMHAGGPFGFVVTVFICPAGTIFCTGGWVRAEMRERLLPEEPETSDSALLR